MLNTLSCQILDAICIYFTHKQQKQIFLQRNGTVSFSENVLVSNTKVYVSNAIDMTELGTIPGLSSENMHSNKKLERQLLYLIAK